MEHRDHTGGRHPKNPPTHLKLRLFCRANWMPLTISGSSGTIASTVTPMKYCREMEVSKPVLILDPDSFPALGTSSPFQAFGVCYVVKACPHPLAGRYPTQSPNWRADEEDAQPPGPHPSPSQRNTILIYSQWRNPTRSPSPPWLEGAQPRDSTNPWWGRSPLNLKGPNHSQSYNLKVRNSLVKGLNLQFLHSFPGEVTQPRGPPPILWLEGPNLEGSHPS